jgi:hypothetical protein
MRYDRYFEQQPRWIEIAVGVALLAVLPFCAGLVWMGLREMLVLGGDRASAAIQLTGGAIGVYAAVLARRLLAPPRAASLRPRRLVSQPVLCFMGLLLLGGACVQWRWMELGWRGVLASATLAVACFHLAWRWRVEDRARHSRTDGA